MFSRAKPAPWLPKSGPGLRATRPRSRNAAAGSSPRPRARQSSQARKLACGGRYLTAGSCWASRSSEHRAVGGDLRHDRIEPRPGVSQRSNGGEHAEVGCEQGFPALCQHGRRLRRRGHGDTALEAGDVPALGRRAEDHSLARDVVVERLERHVPGAGQHQRRMDLVDEDRDAVAGAQVRDAHELVAAPHPAERVMRAAQEVGLDSRLAERCIERRRGPGRSHRGSQRAEPRRCAGRAARSGRRTASTPAGE